MDQGEIRGSNTGTVLPAGQNTAFGNGHSVEIGPLQVLDLDYSEKLNLPGLRRLPIVQRSGQESASYRVPRWPNGFEFDPVGSASSVTYGVADTVPFYIAPIDSRLANRMTDVAVGSMTMGIGVGLVVSGFGEFGYSGGTLTYLSVLQVSSGAIYASYGFTQVIHGLRGPGNRNLGFAPVSLIKEPADWVWAQLRFGSEASGTADVIRSVSP